MSVPGSDAEVEIACLALLEDVLPPRYAHIDDAGADLASAETFELAPGERRLVRTGVAIALPTGYAGFVHPRSGLAARHGLSIVNAPGTIDAGYRGEIRVCLINTDRTNSVRISSGDRIAQLVVQPVSRAKFLPVSELPGSERPGSERLGPVRGTSGHGSTGGLSSSDGSAGGLSNIDGSAGGLSNSDEEQQSVIGS